MAWQQHTGDFKHQPQNKNSNKILKPHLLHNSRVGRRGAGCKAEREPPDPPKLSLFLSLVVLLHENIWESGAQAVQAAHAVHAHYLHLSSVNKEKEKEWVGRARAGRGMCLKQVILLSSQFFLKLWREQKAFSMEQTPHLAPETGALKGWTGHGVGKMRHKVGRPESWGRNPHLAGF